MLQPRACSCCEMGVCVRAKNKCVYVSGSWLAKGLKTGDNLNGATQEAQLCHAFRKPVYLLNLLLCLS